ncbi:iron transporter [Brucella pseudogrignonensis]|uniref:Iron permease FTR1 family protein n=1 Tax=Brucella pseudogrignonensis TaxID=419475 RepID=A0A256G2K9_9HYPH|nr:iron uptake transporter permease EfeU [Brucella pseudogrignonensis]EMG52313.1 iron permease FTR1 [Ochrobactrum sp. CDB2]MCM0752144.1 iron transporter [Brucella pseudogrignonensis]NKX16568.1 iron transporter [Brucella pseudogrignonensis]NNV19821.1 iron transporter [Brucella pseudogrignonensis]OYR21313.1 iron permease FTR1 family protein [Brucella pseudogrignonensis]
MLVPFLIMFREGVEAALIVGIIASYLHQTGRSAWMPVVWIGVLLALAMSLAVGAILQLVSAEFPQKAQELFEAIIGLIAVFVLTSMVFWMRKAARSIKAELHHSIDAAFETPTHKGFGLILMVFFAVAREGLESVFFLLAAFQQSEGGAAPLGALLGVLLAALVGYGIYRGGLKLNLRRFFRWTGVFILIIAAGILANSVMALHEAGIWNQFQTVVFDTSEILPLDSTLGSVLAGIFGYIATPTISEVVAYLGFLVPALIIFLMPSSAPAQSAAAKHTV